MPWSRDVRSFVVETKRTLSPAAAVSAAGSDQPKLPLSKPLSPKPLPAARRPAWAGVSGAAARRLGDAAVGAAATASAAAGGGARRRARAAASTAAPRRGGASTGGAGVVGALPRATSSRSSCRSGPAPRRRRRSARRRARRPALSGSACPRPARRLDGRFLDRRGAWALGLGLGALARGHGGGERQRLIERQRGVERQLARRHALDERADDGAGGNRRLGADDDADGAARADQQPRLRLEQEAPLGEVDEGDFGSAEQAHARLAEQVGREARGRSAIALDGVGALRLTHGSRSPVRRLQASRR